MPESSIREPSLHEGSILRFEDHGEFDPRAGLTEQVRTAQALAMLMDKDKITPENFKTFRYALTASRLDRGSVMNLQDALVRDATKRLVVLVALVVADGDTQKANELLGDHHPEFGSVEDYNAPRINFDFAESVNDMMRK